MISTTKPSRCPVHKSVVSDVTSVGLSLTVFQEFSARPFRDLPTCRGEWERAQNSSIVTFSIARANSDLGMKSQGPFTEVRTVKSGLSAHQPTATKAFPPTPRSAQACSAKRMRPSHWEHTSPRAQSCSPKHEKKRQERQANVQWQLFWNSVEKMTRTYNECRVKLVKLCTNVSFLFFSFSCPFIHSQIYTKVGNLDSKTKPKMTDTVPALTGRRGRGRAVSL